MTYYLKYRPQTLDDLDLTEVRESLKKIIKSKKIPHALLFSGPKGSGKTSAARILAKVVNCESTSLKLRGSGKIEPCNRCRQCKTITAGNNIDVIELDAASHRGIDDVRSLRSAVKLATAAAKMKVYIIDEAHMLTTEASNALLKTLEEPPEHVMFILATTNPEKLIETIRSRTLNVLFKKATEKEMLRSLGGVAKGEKLKVNNELLTLIAQASDGSFRDAVKILEQLVSEKIKLDKKNVEKFLFGKAVTNVDKLILLLVEKETKKALKEIEKIVESGGSMKVLLEALVSKLRSALLAKVGIGNIQIDELNKNDLILLIKLFSKANSELGSAVLEQIPVEIAIIEWCEREKESSKSSSSSISRRDSTSRSPDSIKTTGQASRMGRDDSEKSQNEQSSRFHQKYSLRVRLKQNSGNSEKISPKTPNKKLSQVTDEVWAEILSKVRPINTSTEALLRAARPVDYDGKTLTVGVFYSFHKERLESHQHKKLLGDVAMQVLGNPVRIDCILTEPLPKKQEVEEKSEVVLTELNPALTEDKDDDIIKVAKEIFGS